MVMDYKTYSYEKSFEFFDNDLMRFFFHVEGSYIYYDEENYLDPKKKNELFWNCLH